MKYEVPIVYRGQSNYIIEASSKEEAEERAEAAFANGDMGVPLGNEWEEIERIGEISEVAETTEPCAECKMGHPTEGPHCSGACGGPKLRGEGQSCLCWTND